MINASNFVNIAKEKGFRFYTGVPCSYFKSLINYVIDDTRLHYTGATNEGDAVAIASGVQLGGKPAIVMLQNSGLGNAVNPLTSLVQTFRIPILLIVSWRGQPNGAPDAPQHNLMGHITPQLLELMGIPWSFFPSETANIASVLDKAIHHMHQNKPYALIMKKNSVTPYTLQEQLEVKPRMVCGNENMEKAALTGHWTHLPGAVRYMRSDMLQAIQSGTTYRDVLLATTGYTGRELYGIADRENQLYQAGSMGCVSSLGLGIAMAQPQKKVIVIDGDGAALMRLGAWATIGYERPANLVHILLDNQQHESTGGQSTVAPSIDFCAMASACGYPEVIQAETPEALKKAIKTAHTLTFIYARIKAGVAQTPPRPGIQPPEVAGRLSLFLNKT